jgi:hypothetical protein
MRGAAGTPHTAAMKAVAADSTPVGRSRQGSAWPVATAAVLMATAVLTVLQFPFPGVRLALWRDPDALAAGQWWRLVTPLFVQDDRVSLLGFGLGALLLWRDRRQAR